MNFIFGIAVGGFITMFCLQPDRLGNILHWAGDKVTSQEQIDILNYDE
jgi:hypothetical protein